MALVKSGDAAVILFFILSGFVLALPFLGARAPSYPGFLAKRVCRIYLPYLAAVALAIACAAILGDEALPGLSQWANAPWQDGFGVGVLVGHATMLGSFTTRSTTPCCGRWCTRCASRWSSRCSCSRSSCWACGAAS